MKTKIIYVFILFVNSSFCITNILYAQWVQVNNGLTNLYVNALTTSGNYLFAGTNDGVFRSNDNGATWAQVNNGFTYPYVNTLASLGNYIFAGTHGGGIYRSTNNGSSWIQINNGLTNLNILDLFISDTYLFLELGEAVYFSQATMV